MSKNLYRYQKWDVEYCLLCWFCIVQNFWQATKASLLWAKPPYRSSAICATASCSGFVWLTASILAWTRGGSPSKIAPFRGKGVFGKDAEIRTHQALHDAKPSECPKGDRDNKSEVYFKNRLFLQAD